VNGLKAEVDPAEVGLDAGRLRRIDDSFATYVDDGKLAGWLVTVSRHGKLAHVSAYGQRDREEGLPVETDTLWRIFSMTKPITSVAAMMLYEEGALQLNDPVSKFIPSFADLRVYAGGSDQRPLTVPASEPMRVWHLLTHTGRRCRCCSSPARSGTTGSPPTFSAASSRSPRGSRSTRSSPTASWARSA
jgi:CubicO group peptidase (beta-lactamase class C family)